jgi:hypothetical protein
MYTDLYTGALVEPAELTDEQWTTLGDGHSELGRVLLDESGVRQVFHPHADAHVDANASITRFLELTDPTARRPAARRHPHPPLLRQLRPEVVPQEEARRGVLHVHRLVRVVAVQRPLRGFAQ